MSETDGRGDASFVGEALARHERGLLAYAVGITGDLERARDAVQETFVELLQQPRAALEPRLAAWLFTVCRNRALDAMRKERRMQPLAEGERRTTGEGAGGDPAARAEAGDTAGRVLRALAELPEREREVLRLKFQGGLAYRDIAEVTGLSVANVGFLIHTGMKRLRERLRLRAGLEVRA